MKEVEAVVLDGRLFHNNPAMDWQIAQVEIKEDEKGNLYPGKGARKNDPNCKIDGPVALIMAMGIYLRAKDTGSLDDWVGDPVAIS